MTIAYLRRGEFYDDARDARLDKKKVAEARPEEMKYFETIGAYKKVPYAQAIERTVRRATDDNSSVMVHTCTERTSTPTPNQTRTSRCLKQINWRKARCVGHRCGRKMWRGRRAKET